MKVTTHYDDGSPDYEYDDFTLVAVNDKGESMRFNIGRGEPEDMYLFRDLADVLSVPDLMQMAYDAGKNGEKLEFIESDEEL